MPKRNPMKIGYARVSTDEQSVYQQVDALNEAGCEKIFMDEGISAVAKNRPGLEEAHQYLQSGDIFMVWAIDRAFRSTIEAILFLDDLLKAGIEFKSLTQQIDTTTPEGRKWFIDTASWAEYERAIISRRTKEKMAAAKRRGQHMGRPYALTDDRIHAAHKKVVEEEAPISHVAGQLSVSHDTLTRGFKRLGLQT
ncbi:MAG: recombinase family protein [Candidatus Polarisedimenticolaceae bacterium]|nr:recombinase family protein [Candidatus Polarisedimenticolaceae bacterium]